MTSDKNARNRVAGERSAFRECQKQSQEFKHVHHIRLNFLVSAGASAKKMKAASNRIIDRLVAEATEAKKQCMVCISQPPNSCPLDFRSSERRWSSTTVGALKGLEKAESSTRPMKGRRNEGSFQGELRRFLEDSDSSSRFVSEHAPTRSECWSADGPCHCVGSICHGGFSEREQQAREDDFLGEYVTSEDECLP